MIKIINSKVNIKMMPYFNYKRVNKIIIFYLKLLKMNK